MFALMPGVRSRVWARPVARALRRAGERAWRFSSSDPIAVAKRLDPSRARARAAGHEALVSILRVL